ncbi:hypothetical protein ACA910_007089 [Epithemia clementina (nom. ined.)]
MESFPQSNVRSLFGGAVTCCIPEGFVDISDFRQVPSHQECWEDPSGRLLVVEILDLQTSPDDAAGEFFFRDLAESNGISSPDDFRYVSLGEQPNQIETFPSESVLCFGKGYQKIAKGRDYDVFGNRRQPEQEAKWVCIELCAVRLRNVKTDILVTMSVPNESNPQDTSTGSDLFRMIVASLRIRDWGLFG